VSKADVKNLFREGREVKILIGTDSLSEGLNLQTCGKVINYDMPWNFMRVEQRIGRVDRIGGRPLVEVSSYFYRDTVEEQVYSGISEDFDWFEDVVGPAQPVLSQVERAIEHLAMEAPGTKRDKDVEDRVRAIREQIDLARNQAVTIADAEGGVLATHDSRPPAITLEGMETVLLEAGATARRLRPHETIRGAYWFGHEDGPELVTMRRSVLDAHAPDVTLLTYGSEAFTRLMQAADVKDVTLVDGRFPVGDTTVATLGELDAAIDRAG
jgi:superfamily II DNA/RNA helicase